VKEQGTESRELEGGLEKLGRFLEPQQNR